MSSSLFGSPHKQSIWAIGDLDPVPLRIHPRGATIAVRAFAPQQPRATFVDAPEQPRSHIRNRDRTLVCLALLVFCVALVIAAYFLGAASSVWPALRGVVSLKPLDAHALSPRASGT